MVRFSGSLKAIRSHFDDPSEFCSVFFEMVNLVFRVVCIIGILDRFDSLMMYGLALDFSSLVGLLGLSLVLCVSGGESFNCNHGESKLCSVFYVCEAFLF